MAGLRRNLKRAGFGRQVWLNTPLLQRRDGDEIDRPTGVEAHAREHSADDGDALDAPPAQVERRRDRLPRQSRPDRSREADLSGLATFHNLDFFLRQPVQFVQQFVNLSIRRVNLTLVQLAVGL